MAKPTTALIVDDEPHVRMFLKLVLMELGIKRVWEAGNGQQGLELAEEHAPKLMLLDLNLPVIGGLDVLRQMSLVHPETPVVVITSQNMSSVVMDCQKLGAVGYVLKHTPREALREELREILEGLDDSGDDDAGTAGETTE